MGYATPITILRTRIGDHSDVSPRPGTFVYRTELRALTDPGCGSVVVVQHAAQTLAALDQDCNYQVFRFRANQSVGQTLVIALAEKMGAGLNCAKLSAKE